MALTFGSLFAGIGGFDLGLERSGMECRWQVEIDPFCQKVLRKHWPDVPKYEDVRDVGKHNLEAVGLVAGGFPCQDISNAGKRAGIQGQRSGLWSEYHRIICELQPRYVLVENVAALLVRGMDVVLGDLASCGYDAEWDYIPAAAFGAPYCRDRVFVLAFKPNSINDSSRRICTGFKPLTITSGDYGKILPEKRAIERYTRWRGISSQDWWHKQDESRICRVADGVPNQVDRLKSLGNAVVPQVAEWLGHRIVEADRST